LDSSTDSGEMSRLYDERLKRLKDAVALRKPDRVPVVPLLDSFPARHTGMTQAEAFRDPDKAMEAFLQTQRDFDFDGVIKPGPGWNSLGDHRMLSAPVKYLIPGVDIGDEDLLQASEAPLFEREDYKTIADKGWNEFWRLQIEKGHLDHLKNPEDLGPDDAKSYQQRIETCRENGFVAINGTGVDDPTHCFSMCRTLTGFTMDVFEVPDLVDAALEAATEDLIKNALESYRNSGTRAMGIWMTMERCSGAIYRLNIFERFLWPHLKRYIETFVAEGIVPWMHMDTDWSLNLPYYKDLPKGKCIVDLDSTTDIFKAKEVLDGHMCISGDVNATMLSLGQPEDVDEYCEKLINLVGGNGGFILSSGCEMPIDAKTENFRAMCDSAKKYA
jgi:uroporphyrinogen-III decarboxylase